MRTVPQVSDSVVAVQLESQALAWVLGILAGAAARSGLPPFGFFSGPIALLEVLAPLRSL